MRIEPLKLMPAGLSKLTDNDATPETGTKNSFGEVLSQALSDVNQQQQAASQASADLSTGKISDVSEVVIATEKASLSLQLAMAVRTKVLDAYQQVMQMQV